jgi:hypothetical protein
METLGRRAKQLRRRGVGTGIGLLETDKGQQRSPRWVARTRADMNAGLGTVDDIRLAPRQWEVRPRCASDEDGQRQPACPRLLL